MRFKKYIGFSLIIAVLSSIITLGGTDVSFFTSDHSSQNAILKAELPNSGSPFLGLFFEEEDLTEGDDELLPEPVAFTSTPFIAFHFNSIKNYSWNVHSNLLHFKQSAVPIFIKFRNLRI